MHALNEHPLITKYIEMNRFGMLLGMNFEIISPGEVKYNLTIGEDHLATPISAHGGVICSLLDATLGVGALSAVCLDGNVVSTIEMKVSFLKPAFLNQTLTATSQLLKKGQRILFVEALIVNESGEMIAKATGTLNVYPKEKAGY